MRMRNVMAERVDQQTVSPCEYKALKECLERNQGKKEKCEREWFQFQNACTNNKRCVCCINFLFAFHTLLVHFCRLAAQQKLSVPGRENDETITSS